MVQRLRAAWCSRVTIAELSAWLATVRCTVPFTTDDMRELYEMVKGYLPDYRVEVYWTDKVYVRVFAPGVTATNTPTFSTEIAIA